MSYNGEGRGRVRGYLLIDHAMADDNGTIIRARGKEWVLPVERHRPQRPPVMPEEETGA